jgi:hypothetical protein
MPYDPALPANGAKVKAAELRGQFAGLKELIDSGTGITSIVVDSVTTLAPGEPASVTVGIDGSVLHLNLAFPQGQPGAQGVPGVQGPPFANVVIDSVMTLAPGQPATVSVSFDGTNVHLSFGIPQGAQGEQGIQGIQGVPGEVTATAMNGAISTAIAGTSNNTNGVATLDTPFADPDMEALRQKLNEMLLAQRR